MAGTALTSLGNSDTALTALGRGLQDYTLLSSVMAGLSIMKAMLFMVPLLDGIALLLMCSFAAWVSITDEKMNLPTRIAKYTIMMGLVGLVVASFAVTAYAIPIALFALVCANRLWDIGNAICKRFFGDWKKTKDKIAALKNELDEIHEYKNKLDRTLGEIENLSDEDRIKAQKQLLQEAKEKQNQLFQLEKADRDQFFALMNNLHGLATVLISLTGVILLIPPFTTIGIAILFAVGVYNLMNTFDLNPLRWFADRFFGEWKALDNDIDKLIDELKDTTLVPEIRQEKEKQLAKLQIENQTRQDAFPGKVHSLLIFSAALVGGILLVPPFTVIGGIVLGAVGLYTLIAKKYDLNPVKGLFNTSCCLKEKSSTAIVQESLPKAEDVLKAEKIVDELLAPKTVVPKKSISVGSELKVPTIFEPSWVGSRRLRKMSDAQTGSVAEPKVAVA